MVAYAYPNLAARPGAWFIQILDRHSIPILTLPYSIDMDFDRLWSIFQGQSLHIRTYIVAMHF
jgi:hypothetical protein